MNICLLGGSKFEHSNKDRPAGVCNDDTVAVGFSRMRSGLLPAPTKSILVTGHQTKLFEVAQVLRLSL